MSTLKHTLYVYIYTSIFYSMFVPFNMISEAYCCWNSITEWNPAHTCKRTEYFWICLIFVQDMCTKINVRKFCVHKVIHSTWCLHKYMCMKFSHLGNTCITVQVFCCSRNMYWHLKTVSDALNKNTLWVLNSSYLDSKVLIIVSQWYIQKLWLLYFSGM